MGPDHTDSGGWARAGLDRQLTKELEEQRALVAQMRMRVGKRDVALIRAQAELQLREEVARRTAAFYLGPDPPLELVHAMRCAGPSSVWLDIDGRKVLVRVAGNGRPDEARERAVYRHLIDAHGLPRAAVCGYWVQAMPGGLLGYTVRDRAREIILNTDLVREERRRTRASISASLKSGLRDSRRPGLLGMVAPFALLLASMRAAARDLVANSTGMAATTLTTATATLVTAVAIAPMPPAGLGFDAAGPRFVRQGPVRVAENVPLGLPLVVSSSPRPSAVQSKVGAGVVPSGPPPVVPPVVPPPVDAPPVEPSPVETPPTEPSPPAGLPVPDPAPEPTPSETAGAPPQAEPSPVPEISETAVPPPVVLNPVEQPPVPVPTGGGPGDPATGPTPAEPTGIGPTAVPSPVADPATYDGDGLPAVCFIDQLADSCMAG